MFIPISQMRRLRFHSQGQILCSLYPPGQEVKSLGMGCPHVRTSLAVAGFRGRVVGQEWGAQGCMGWQLSLTTSCRRCHAAELCSRRRRPWSQG